jgi:hypothetical protein
MSYLSIMFMTKKHNAFILISVTWIVLILSLLVLSQMKRSQFDFVNQKYAKTDFRLRMAAKSGFNQILASMSAEVIIGNNKYDAHSDAWGWETIQKTYGKNIDEDYPDVQLSVILEDEDSKIILHKASGTLIADLFRAIGWSDIEAEDISHDIRERSDFVMQSLSKTQAEIGQNEAEILDVRYLLGLRNLSSAVLFGEDINFNGELDSSENDGSRSFPMDDRNGILRRGLTGLVTIRGDGNINPNFAPYEVLFTVPGVSETIAEEIVRKRTGYDGVAGTEDDFVFEKREDLLTLSSISQFREFEYNKMINHMRMTSKLFTIRICATMKDSSQLFRIQTCVERKDDGKMRILSWIEDTGY